MNGESYKDHETRILLYDHICQNPGITFQLLKSTFKLKEGTLRYHLKYLIKRKRIILEKKGRERCYYSFLKREFPFTDPGLNLNIKQERILEIISIEPGISKKEIRVRSGMDRASFDYNFQRLKDLKMIWRINKEKNFGYEVVTKDKLTMEVFLKTVQRFLKDEVDKKTLMEVIEGLKEFKDEVELDP